MANSKNTNGRNGTQADTGTIHIRLPLKTIRLIRRQAKDTDRTMSAFAGMLLRKGSETYQRVIDKELRK